MRSVRRIFRHRSMVAMMILIFLMVIGFLVEKEWIDRVEEERSFEQLYQEAEEMAREIEAHAKADREQLELLATVIAGCDDLASQEVWDILGSYITIGMMSRLELLLPDDTVLIRERKKVDVSGQISFAEEAERGAHISERTRDWSGEHEYILRHYVPVVREGETIAMLYGVVELGSLPQNFIVRPYDDQAAIYIIEGSDGDFLVDTWHEDEELGNIWAEGTRTMAPGYNHEQLKQGLIDGKRDYVVFVSQTTGSFLYMYYMPLAINDWRIALSVPEEVVLSDAHEIRSITNCFLVFEGACFLLVFLSGVWFVREESKEKQRSLDVAHYIYDVGKLLFDAHVKHENIQLALAKVGETIAGDEVVLQMSAANQEKLTYLWQKEDKHKEKKKEKWERNMLALLAYFREGHDYLAAHDAAVLQKWLPWEKNMKNMIAVPIKNADGHLYGVLLACNAADTGDLVELFKSMGLNFSMLYRNMQSYDSMREQGETDALLGIYNRNRYEADLPKYPKMYHTSLACVYMDVNGLHELNNQQGHGAGDQALKRVAEELQRQYGFSFTYRIGGDEFVAFVVDEEEKNVRYKGEDIRRKLEENGIYVSVGIAWEKAISDMDTLVKSAEKQMYERKQQFYEYTRYQRGY